MMSELCGMGWVYPSRRKRRSVRGSLPRGISLFELNRPFGSSTGHSTRGAFALDSARLAPTMHQCSVLAR